MNVLICRIRMIHSLLMLLLVQVGLGQTTVFFAPATHEMSIGEMVTLSVHIATTDSLHAYQMNVRFDNTILQYTGATEGPYLQSGPFGTFFFSYPAPNSGADSVTANQAILGPDAISGSGVLFSVTFKAVGTGITLAMPDVVTLFRRDGVTTFGATVQASQIAVGVPLPVQLVTFNGNAVALNKVHLEWATASEVNNYGFFVERRGKDKQRYRELPNSFVPGHGTTLSPQHYSYTDEEVGAGEWDYRLRQVDLDGEVHYSWTVHVLMSKGADGDKVPIIYNLMQNYPNPFNPTTTIAFTLPVAGIVSLDVFDLLGEHVVTLLSAPLGAGRHSVAWNASRLSSGVYVCKLAVNNVVQTKKLVLTK